MTRQLRVLLVDDSASVRRRLALLLEEMGEVQVVEAADVASALEEARRLGPDVVVLDIRLRGGETGLAVLDVLERLEEPPLVIVLTNHPAEHYRRWCRQHGADYFFDKSTEFEKVPQVLDALRTG